MTPEQLELFQIRAHIFATQSLLVGLTRILSRSQTDPDKFLRALVESLRSKYTEMTIPDVPPEYSDMVTGEFQDAIDDLIKLFDK